MKRFGSGPRPMQWSARPIDRRPSVIGRIVRETFPGGVGINTTRLRSLHGGLLFEASANPASATATDFSASGPSTTNVRSSGTGCTRPVFVSARHPAGPQTDRRAPETGLTGTDPPRPAILSRFASPGRGR